MMRKLADFQADLPKLKKEKQGYNYKYFDINQMIEVMTPILKKHELTIFQPLTHLDGKPAIATVICNTKTGVTVEFVTPLMDLQDAQKMGGCITYFRRYALQSLFFMEAEDDDAAETGQMTYNAKDKPF